MCVRRRSCVFAVVVIWGLVSASSCLAAPGTKDPYPPPVAPLSTLVDGGNVRTAIVAPQEPTNVEQHAINELQSYLARITGATVPIATDVPRATCPIYVGSAAQDGLAGVDWAELGEDGFVLESGSGGVRIAGASDLGTLFGVYQFLEKHLGVRWFMPGEIGEVVPKTETLQVGTFREVEVPSFRIRWIEQGDWALRQKMNVAVTVDDQPVGVNWKWSFHTHFRLIPPDKYFGDHPQWFAEHDGRRRRPKDERSGQLCTSNPALIEEMARQVIAQFDEDPTLDILALAPQDGGGFCECAACTALDEQRPDDEAWHARYSNRLAVFNNEVARRVARVHPDKLIKVGAYAMYLRVPQTEGFRPEPNLAVQVCHTYSCNSHPIASPDCEGNTKYFRGELEHWARIADHLFIYEYYNKGMWGGLPYYQVHLIRQDLPYLHELGVESFYTQAAGRRWPACGINHYIAAKLAWDVRLDVDRLMDDFCEKFYGAAAAPMRRYWQAMEDAFAGYEECLSPYGRKWPTLVMPDIFTPEALAEMGRALAAAEEAAQDDRVAERIGLIRARHDFTKQTMDYLAAVQAPFQGIDLSDARAVTAAHREAKRIGEPISRKLVAFARAHDIGVFPRVIQCHDTLRFLVSLPDREPILK